MTRFAPLRASAQAASCVALLACSTEEIHPLGTGGAGTNTAASSTSSTGGAGGSPVMGALVGVSMKGRVSLLLDELPLEARDRAATEALAWAPSLWESRARSQ